jgi:lysophospholipase L1-like esterase
MPKTLAFLLFFSVAVSISSVAQTDTNAPTASSGGNPALVPAPRTETWATKPFQDGLARGKKGQIDLLFDGDSITNHFGNDPVFKERYGKLNAADFAVPGDTVQTVLWRVENGEYDGIHPKLLVLMIGTNNIPKIAPEQIAEGIQNLLGEIKKRLPDTHILLLGILPRGNDPVHNDQYGWRTKITKTNKIIATFADGKQVTYIDIGAKFLQPDGSISKDIMGDYLHPTVAGNKIYADGIEAVIDQYFTSH